MSPAVTLFLLLANLISCILLVGLTGLQAQPSYPTGTLRDDGRYDLQDVFDLGSDALTTPAKYSLKDDLPRVGNQVNAPIDVGWAIAHATTILENRSKILKSEVKFRSPDFVNMLLSGDRDICESGVSLSEAVNALANTGIPSIRDYREVCPQGVNEEILNLARSEEIYAFQKVFDRDMTKDEKVRRIKRKVSLDQPVIMAMHTPRSFLTPGEFWQPKETIPEEWPLHSMVIVGYDDNRAGGAFELVNSWGKDWGNESFTWIRYSDFDFVRYAYSVSYLRDLNSNISGIKGRFILRDMATQTDLAPDKSDHRGLYQFKIADRRIDFELAGSIDKPFYLKMYYRSGDDISIIYPTEEWRSSLFEFSYQDFRIPGDDSFYTIDDNVDAILYGFISFRDLDGIDLKPMVEKYDSIEELITTNDYPVTRVVFWETGDISFSGKMGDRHVLPFLIKLEF